MPKSRAQSVRIFRHVGKLVVRWNDLELQMRRLVQYITEDWFIVHVLTAEIPAEKLIRVLKLLAAERDADMTKLNRFTAAAAEKTGRHGRKIDMVSEHVGRVVDCADSLRLYRNMYAHGITSPTVYVNKFTVSGWTTRKGRLAEYNVPLKLAEIARATSLIGQVLRYAGRVERCLKANSDSRTHSPVKWPQKLAVPAAPKKPLWNINERIPLF
jgi:hypothetical protein